MASRKSAGAVMTIERGSVDPRNITITLACSHGTVSRRFNAKKTRNLGEGYLKSSVALGHDFKFRCDCELVGDTVKTTRKPRTKKEAVA